ncbi:MAG: carbohydrate kinase family protein [Methanobacterium sp.]
MNNTSNVEVAALGTCNIDFIMKVPRFSIADDEVDVENMTVSLGGSASNFAVGVSRMNVNVGIIARVGNDQFGDFVTNKFMEERVQTQRLLKIHKSTGMAFIAVDRKGERSIYASMGANAQFKLEKDDKKYIKSSSILHITGMYQEVVEEASKYAKFLSLNPGTVLSSYGIDSLYKIIKRANIIFLNEKEISLLTGEDLKEGSKLLIEMGVPMVVVTCGKRGANLYTSEGVIHSSPQKVKSLDTTGAGDAFAAGFIASFVKNQEIHQCLQFGNIMASKCVGNLGAINIPTIEHINFLN